MREAGDACSSPNRKIPQREAAAEATTLAEKVVDFIIAGQAFSLVRSRGGAS